MRQAIVRHRALQYRRGRPLEFSFIGCPQAAQTRGGAMIAATRRPQQGQVGFMR